METRKCQNCQNDFIIEPDDFSFYQKIQVPPPTFCPECRRQRRMAWRNERSLYRRQCDLCKKNIIAMYHESAPFPVYCRECWYGDGWDPTVFGREYDFSKNFFEQWKELQDTVPRLALFQRNAINSDYSNMVGEGKNVYLSVSVVLDSENIYYSKTIDKSKDIVDCLNVNDSQSLYENIEGEKNYNCQYMLLSRNCLDSYFLVDCVNCSNCVLSNNLRNKEFYIRNQKYSKEDYLVELEKLNLKSRVSREKLLGEFKEIKERTIYRFANIVRSVNSTGNNLFDVKNCLSCFDADDAENARYCYRVLNVFKDAMDCDFCIRSELMYEYANGGLNAYNVKFSCAALNAGRNLNYTDYCQNCTDIFGCISLKNKQYVFLNKQYSKEEYEKLRAEIIKQMETMPFTDKGGRIYKYGEFFPIELSPWAYNETLAQEINPLTKEEAEKKGYVWRDPEVKNFSITMPVNKIPDTIDEVDEKIFEEILECKHGGSCNHQCNTAFKIANFELAFYKKMKIPLPTLCPNCRYYERFPQTTALKLWHRKCMCSSASHFHGAEKCTVEFETAYSPDRPEIVYCEKCYQQEVY
jgi:hypothetical protein